MKALSRLLLSAVAMGGAVAALSTPANAVLQFSVGEGGSEQFFTCVDNASCDSDPATGTISIPTMSFQGVTVTNVKVWATADSLNFTVGSVTNDTESPLNGIFAVSDTDFSNPSKHFKDSFTTKWSNAPGSTVELIWAADGANEQGANTPEDAPGTAYDAFNLGTVSGNDTGGTSSSGPLAVSSPLSLTIQGSIDLAAGGSESASVSTTTAVPEASTWTMLIAGFAGLGIAGYRASRKRGALAI